MSFIEDNAAYESWLRKQCDVVDADLAVKHERMSRSAFRFMRATYFRWARTIETLLPDLANAPAVLAIGDLHLSNFGTWRDAEGRLVWGVNDFDDAAIMPYSFDLVRLCASVRLTDSLAIKAPEAAASIIVGYKDGLAAPRASLLDGQEAWLRPFLAASDTERRKFWQEIDELTPAEPDKAIRKGFKKSLPDGISDLKMFTQSKGGGSLGRPRFVATAEWKGGRIVREAKAVVPSAWEWAHDAAKGATSHFLDLAESAYRAPDPFLISHEGFIFRRLSPDARKLDLEQGVPAGLEALFLHTMGFELGALHAADKNSGAIAAHLSSLPKSWLADASEAAAGSIKADFKEWKQAAEAKGGPKGKVAAA